MNKFNIPSIFARLYEANFAFQKLTPTNNVIISDKESESIVQSILDLIEFIFIYGDNSPLLCIEAVDISSIHSDLLKDVFESDLSIDKNIKSYHHWHLIYIENNLVGGGSPYTIVYTSNIGNIKNRYIGSSGNILFSEKYIPLNKRSLDFQSFILSYVQTYEISDEFKSYVLSNINIQEINIYDLNSREYTFADSKNGVYSSFHNTPLISKINKQKCNNYLSKSYYELSNINNGVNDSVPIVFSDSNEICFNDIQIKVKGEQIASIPYTERFLPGTGWHVPYLCREDIFEDVLIEMPFGVSNSKVLISNGEHSYAWPIKQTILKYVNGYALYDSLKAEILKNSHNQLLKLSIELHISDNNNEIDHSIQLTKVFTTENIIKLKDSFNIGVKCGVELKYGAQYVLAKQIIYPLDSEDNLALYNQCHKLLNIEIQQNRTYTYKGTTYVLCDCNSFDLIRLKIDGKSGCIPVKMCHDNSFYCNSIITVIPSQFETAIFVSEKNNHYINNNGRTKNDYYLLNEYDDDFVFVCQNILSPFNTNYIVPNFIGSDIRKTNAEPFIDYLYYDLNYEIDKSQTFEAISPYHLNRNFEKVRAFYKVLSKPLDTIYDTNICIAFDNVISNSCRAFLSNSINHRNIVSISKSTALIQFCKSRYLRIPNLVLIQFDYSSTKISFLDIKDPKITKTIVLPISISECILSNKQKKNLYRANYNEYSDLQDLIQDFVSSIECDDFNDKVKYAILNKANQFGYGSNMIHWLITNDKDTRFLRFLTSRTEFHANFVSLFFQTISVCLDIFGRDKENIDLFFTGYNLTSIFNSLVSNELITDYINDLCKTNFDHNININIENISDEYLAISHIIPYYIEKLFDLNEVVDTHHFHDEEGNLYSKQTYLNTLSDNVKNILINPRSHVINQKYFDCSLDGEFKDVVKTTLANSEMEQGRELTKEYDIFISYRREGGKEVVRALKSELKDEYKIFLDFDELEHVGTFDDRILDAIESAKIFVFVYTSKCLDRCDCEDDWISKEIRHAIKTHKIIIPLNVDLALKIYPFPSNLPKDIKKGLGQHQFINFYTEQDFEHSIVKIKTELRCVFTNKLNDN